MGAGVRSGNQLFHCLSFNLRSLVCVCRIVVLAGDTLPIDVYCHLPVMCEDRNLPYAYIPSKVVSLLPPR